MSIMDRAADAAAARREQTRRRHEQEAQRRRDEQARLLTKGWAVPAAYDGAADLTVEDSIRPPSGVGRRILRPKAERHDTYLLAGEVRVAFIYDGSAHLELRLIQTCAAHGDFPAGSLDRYRDTAPGEDGLVVAVAAALTDPLYKQECAACRAAREQATCPTCGHDLSEPRAVQW